MTQNSPDQAANIIKLKISSNFGDGAIDISGGVVDFQYYESVLSNHITCTIAVMETGFAMDKSGKPKASKGIIDSLPIRGGERVDIIMEDNYGNELKIDEGLYVNRLRDVDAGTSQDIFFMDLASREYFANEQTRVTKRYEGSISQNVEKILKDVLLVESKPDVDETAEPYNFIGNDKKPFYICTWLASKSIPQMESEEGENATGGAAGYLFFQTREGFHFKSIDKIFAGEPVKKYIFNNSPELPTGFDAKILLTDIESDIDLNEKLTLGTYHNRSIFFDFYALNYTVRDYKLGEDDPLAGLNLTQRERQEVYKLSSSLSNGSMATASKITPAGKKIDDLVAKEFTQSPSRLMTHILDVGTQPTGSTAEEQLEHWKENRAAPNFKAMETMQASIMRYNQLFTVKTNIIIPGDFSIKAGDVVFCDFPELSGSDKKDTNPESGGLYMVAHVCHKVTSGSTTTSLALVRDSYGKKPTGTNQILA